MFTSLARLSNNCRQSRGEPINLRGSLHFMFLSTLINFVLLEREYASRCLSLCSPASQVNKVHFLIASVSFILCILSAFSWCTKMVKAWYMLEHPEDPRQECHIDPPEEASLEKLASIGVLYDFVSYRV